MTREDIVRGTPMFFKSVDWRMVRLHALQRAGEQCEGRGCHRRAADGYRLDVHHIKPRNLFPELWDDPANLRVMCSQCHLESHRRQILKGRECNPIPPRQLALNFSRD